MTIENQDNPELETDGEQEGQDTQDEPSQEEEGETESPEGELSDENGEGEEEDKDNSAPNWVKEVRRTNKEIRRTNRQQAKRIQELEAKLNTNSSDENLELPPKPTLEDCNYDEDEYEKRTDNWHSLKHKIEGVKQAKQQQIEQQKAEWNKKYEDYNQDIAKLNVDRTRFNEAENVVKEIFSKEQTSAMLLYADNPAKLVYALGRDEDVAEELANIADPAKFIIAIAKHEERLKMKAAKTIPPAERKVNTTSNIKTISVDKKQEQLQKKAHETGDFTEYFAYKKSRKK